MFRGVTEIKGLAIDIDSFASEDFTEFEKIGEKYACVFLTAEKGNYECLIEIFCNESIIFMEPIQKYLAPNIAIHGDIVKKLNVKSSEIAYVSKNHSFLKKAMGFLSGAIWVSNHITYREASVLPDLIIQEISQLEEVLQIKHEGYFGEAMVDPLQQGRATMFPVELDCEKGNFTVYTLGRYYGHDHYMNHVHPYSKAILLNKREGKTYTGVFNEKFQEILSRAIKRLKEHFDIDGICAVPIKPGKMDRYKDILCELSKEHELENYGDTFLCTRMYQDQKELLLEERMKNIRGAFCYEGSLAGKRVILIDDIISTGATIKECVGELKQKGAQEVIVLVLAINQFGNYWSSDIPGAVCSICGEKMHLQVNKDGGFFYSCFNCYQSGRKSPTLSFVRGWEEMHTQENERIEAETTTYEDNDAEWISLKRNITCPYCSKETLIDIEDDCSITINQRSMGQERIYEFDIESHLCEHCQENFRLLGYISEYPLGCVNKEEIHICKE